HLMPMILRMLERCRCEPGDIHGIAVTRGPGTFTGLRIGISTLKGFAAATGASMVGVSSLAALAFPLALHVCPVVAMIDARRGEVYYTQYRGCVQPETRVLLATPETAAAALTENAILVGSGALLYRALFEKRCPGIRFADTTQHVIRAASVGTLAMARFKQHDVDPVDALIPEYVRKSDAQIQLSGSC
ncbi:MAG: tRNA (adenosine(37)-N6)-threonylcarbamoyltransferase complex dimerization subunit type 1 TsaB, partial [Desulfobacteraceae bacterium]|nr:tRNA (adenosine(37)-N6)-threonylcarbamoyltransferase complex dimerization subunit type 1 TsaB [Desulfobacteraceae bacterium]